MLGLKKGNRQQKPSGFCQHSFREEARLAVSAGCREQGCVNPLIPDTALCKYLKP